MTEREKLMYQLIDDLLKSGAPIIIKGALVTKLILIENNYDELRHTNDIDMYWLETPLPSMDELVETINKSLCKIRDDLQAIVKREYVMGEQTAGIDVLNKHTGMKTLSLDINTGSVCEGRIYQCENIDIIGVPANEILADKIFLLSGNIIFRRAKDIADVYALSQCVDVQISEIYDVCRQKGRELGTFDAFYNRRSDLEHAYKKLAGLNNKPHFEDVYSHLSNFIRPFAERNDGVLKWDHVARMWG